MRACPSCKVTKSEEGYYDPVNGRKRSYCKKCHNKSRVSYLSIYRREYRRKHVGYLCNWCYKPQRIIGAYCSKDCKEKKAEANRRYINKRKGIYA